MAELDDHQLLAEFACENSEAAFAALVERHVGLVYSVALRSAGNAHAAEEITQAVFIILARKAEGLSAKIILSGWLYQTTRLTAANFLRTEIRRQHREQEAYMQSLLNEPSATETWTRIAPLLDDALDKLGARDRDAIALRFFENKSFAEVGQATGASEDAAKVRVNRALEKLRKMFTKRGVTLSALAIAGAVSANSVSAAPVGLVATVTATAIKGTVISATLTTLVKGTMKTMTWLKMKFAVGVGVATLLAGGAATVVLSNEKTDSYHASATSPFQLRLVVEAASSNSETMVMSKTNRASGKVFQETLHLQKQVLLDQAAIQSAAIVTNSFIGQPTNIVVDFKLTPTGTKQFAKITRANIGHRLAIIIEGRVINAPVIRAELTGGEGQISGDFSTDEATEIAAKISKPRKQD